MTTPASIGTLSLELDKKDPIPDFDSIRVILASPEQVLFWSYGEVTRPETINYRTQRPERDGLFCQKIFGPVRDWQCACGKYKKIRYKGIICDKCGVEVTRSMVRRERMGHIKLATPVTHIWFLRNIPSKIGLILDLSTEAAEKVVYFASFIITKVDKDLKQEIIQKITEEFDEKKRALKKGFFSPTNKKLQETAQNSENKKAKGSYKEKLVELKLSYNKVLAEVEEITPLKILSEYRYQELSLRYGHIFEAGIGAEAIQKLLKEVDLDRLVKELRENLSKNNSAEEKRLIKKLRLVEALIQNKIRPEWMILEIIPVIPPDLRPMVQLDGGRFASSDLNDLYRRVINRNNRLKRLIELRAPEVICRNEKRMLQEAVDALIDNSARRTKTVTSSAAGKRILKSLADILRGKQGRFRQNLLGKRVDYSGRSVIIVGPYLKLYQCGLPKTMAIELFRPFIISQLIKDGYVFNVKAASRLIDEGTKEVWDILEDVIKNYCVLLNRAPTLHRLSIQAFQPVLIEGKAIQIHPFVCPPFNADFDGDQMAVHLPISKKAQEEAKELMLSSKNILKPATGIPVTIPNQDMVWGCYCMTLLNKQEDPKKIKVFSSSMEAILAYQTNKINLNQEIKVKIENKLLETCVGRILLNDILPKDFRAYDQIINKDKLREIISESIEIYGTEKTSELLDKIKELSLTVITSLGLSWGMDELPPLEGKEVIIEKAEKEIEELEKQYKRGLLSGEERYSKIIMIWIKVQEKISELGKKSLDSNSSATTMIASKARGSWAQLIQMLGMKGLVSNPLGETVELPVKSSFKEGFDMLEYFISTHGARKGLTDTALRTASAGYLTRRLIDVAHELIITQDDCGDHEGIILTKEESEEMRESLVNRIIGRIVLENIIDPKTKKVILKANQVVTHKIAKHLEKLDLKQVKVGSVLSCKAEKGVCRKCYGYDLGYNKLVDIGTAVGIVAAQSIGEPGTQLTLRTFHTGGVLGKDITQGLPRVEEIFEARSLSKEAVISEVNGKVKIVEEENQKKIKVSFKETNKEKYNLKVQKSKLKVKDKQKIKKGDLLFKEEEKEIFAKNSGIVKLENDSISVVYQENGVREYIIPFNCALWVKDGDLVNRGDQLTEGALDLFKLYKFRGREATQRYIIKEIQHIYSSEGQGLNDKHIEIIARQMFSRVYITNPGDSNLSIGEIVTKSYFQEVCREVEKGDGKLPKAKELLLGITRVSLSTESFLSAASFQETSRVLITASLMGKIDKLKGLKENVIIGRLIPVGTGFRKS